MMEIFQDADDQMMMTDVIMIKVQDDSDDDDDNDSYEFKKTLFHSYIRGRILCLLTVIILDVIISCLISSLLLQDGYAALHLASMDGHLETLRTLVELGADKEAKNTVRNNDDDSIQCGNNYNYCC